ncbi:uncharacterized protein LOC122573949 [Bombus pyrosoma]|uniref:uncharacterized protein LOC122573949 n=1 Tax=Bombus pyrosoma TaxID=396416 RepID=UPI001CB95013|nr:uncharacterized protein LOC122573949 [Bombus pyrosoma]
MEWGISAILSSTNINFGPGGVQHGTQKENLETDVDLYVGSGTSSKAPVQFFFRQGNSRLFHLRTRIYVCCLCMCVYARTHRRPHSSRHGFEGITIFLRCVRGASGVNRRSMQPVAIKLFRRSDRVERGRQLNEVTRNKVVETQPQEHDSFI